MKLEKFVRIALSLILFVSLAFAEDSLHGKVVGIADGDTITLRSNDSTYRIRLHGIDAPEKQQPFGTASKKFLSNLIFGESVEVSVKGRDKYDRVIGTILYADKNINRDLVHQGYAWWYRKYAPNDEVLAKLESQARAKKRGLWRDSNPIAPWQWRRGARNDLRQTIAIVGNRRSHIYHCSNCPDFYRISKENRRLFNSESDAIRAGFRKAKNCPP